MTEYNFNLRNTMFKTDDDIGIITISAAVWPTIAPLCHKISSQDMMLNVTSQVQKCHCNPKWGWKLYLSKNPHPVKCEILTSLVYSGT